RASRSDARRGGVIPQLHRSSKKERLSPHPAAHFIRGDPPPPGEGKCARRSIQIKAHPALADHPDRAHASASRQGTLLLANSDQVSRSRGSTPTMAWACQPAIAAAAVPLSALPAPSPASSDAVTAMSL